MLGQDRKLDLALLDVKHRVGDIALLVHVLILVKFHYRFYRSYLRKKAFGVKAVLRWLFHERLLWLDQFHPTLARRAPKAQSLHLLFRAIIEAIGDRIRRPATPDFPILWSILPTLKNKLSNKRPSVPSPPPVWAALCFIPAHKTVRAMFPTEIASGMPLVQKERHRTGRMGWLRAAVLGANDGIVSTASLVLGVAAAHGTRSNVLVAGVAGLVAGAMAMAAGEYVSVHSQADTEQAELERERAELKADDKGEHEELTAIYVARGLEPSLAKQVADQLMAHDALGAHARDELGITETLRARPIQAAFASALSFAVGAAMPLLTTAFIPEASLIFIVPATSLLFL